MIKKTIYPKTQRVKVDINNICEITEKIDGSNLCFFKLNNIIYIAQRNNIISINEIEENKNLLYKGLYGWLNEYKDFLQNELRETSCLCGEWIGMGKIKYSVDEFDKRFYIFAKANVNENMELYNLRYYHDLFIYPFESLKIPNFIGVVPTAYKIGIIPDKNKLDELYEKYCSKINRKVEGFIVNYENNITKYVRFKNGKPSEHFDRT